MPDDLERKVEHDPAASFSLFFEKGKLLIAEKNMRIYEAGPNLKKHLHEQILYLIMNRQGYST